MVRSNARKVYTNFQMKLTGKPNMGNPHVGFGEARAGDGLSSTAPVLDPI